MGELSTVVQALQTEHLATVKRQDRHLRCHNKQGPVPQGWGVKWAWWEGGGLLGVQRERASGSVSISAQVAKCVCLHTFFKIFTDAIRNPQFTGDHACSGRPSSMHESLHSTIEMPWQKWLHNAIAPDGVCQHCLKARVRAN